MRRTFLIALIAFNLAGAAYCCYLMATEPVPPAPREGMQLNVVAGDLEPSAECWDDQLPEN